MKVEKIDHVHACVKDLDAALAFFRVVLGIEFDPIDELTDSWGVRDVSGSGLDMIEITDPGGRVAKEMGHLMRDGLCALSFKVPDIKAAIAELELRGIEMIGPMSEFGAVRQAWFDPAKTFGVQIELCEYPGNDIFIAAGRQGRRSGQGEAKKIKVEKMDHVHACVKDLDNAVAFFQDVFGVEFDPIIELADTWGVRDVRGATGLDLIEVTNPNGKAAKEMGHLFKDGIAAISLKVPDIKTAIAELASQDIKMIGPLTEFGAVKQAWFDPAKTFGVQIELCEYPGDDIGAAAGPQPGQVEQH